MITIQEYLLSKSKPKLNMIKATDDTIKKIVKDELDKLGLDGDLNHIDVSGVTNMHGVFCCFAAELGAKYEDLNPDISKWNVSKAEDMGFMFLGCKKFNQDLSKWNVSKVENMQYMFRECENFNQDLSSWNVSKVEDMYQMFRECKKFNQDISKWNVKNVKYYSDIFEDCPIKEEFKPKFKD